LLACCLLPALEAWPHYLLADRCVKGIALVAPNTPLPTIMNVVPAVGTWCACVATVQMACGHSGRFFHHD
jgi:hypothetical protein